MSLVRASRTGLVRPLITSFIGRMFRSRVGSSGSTTTYSLNTLCCANEVNRRGFGGTIRLCALTTGNNSERTTRGLKCYCCCKESIRVSCRGTFRCFTLNTFSKRLISLCGVNSVCHGKCFIGGGRGRTFCVCAHYMSAVGRSTLCVYNTRVCVHVTSYCCCKVKARGGLSATVTSCRGTRGLFERGVEGNSFFLEGSCRRYMGTRRRVEGALRGRLPGCR